MAEAAVPHGETGDAGAFAAETAAIASRTSAPEPRRARVKLIASIEPGPSAARERRELSAKEMRAATVSAAVLGVTPEDRASEGTLIAGEALYNAFLRRSGDRCDKIGTL